VVHSGVIDNAAALKRQLTTEGHEFKTDEEWEVLAHLVESYYEGVLARAVAAALREVKGSLSLLAITTMEGLKLTAASWGAPLIIGFGENEMLVASDEQSIVPYASHVVALGDRETASVGDDSVELFASIEDSSRADVRHLEPLKTNRRASSCMLSEIFEQPDAIRNTLRGRMDSTRGVLLEYEIGPAEVFRVMKHVVVVAGGASRHAAFVGKCFIESFAGLRVEVEYPSEFRERTHGLPADTLFVAVTPFGEGADIINAMRHARNQGAFVLLVCDSTHNFAVRIADAVLCTHAGQERGTAPTKMFTCQLSIFYQLALFLGGAREAMTHDEIRIRLHSLNRVPEYIERILDNSRAMEALAERFCDSTHAVLLARGINLPIALDGAHKLRQTCRIHADAYPCDELRHASIALAAKGTPVLALLPQDNLNRKLLIDLAGLRAIGGTVVAIATERDREAADKVDYVFRVAEADAFTNPFLTAVSVQLYSYFGARLRGLSVDRPENTAREVMLHDETPWPRSPNPEFP
jgi:glucosamine--fructose-6-phosphate aminotransferase (isomerizing)